MKFWRFAWLTLFLVTAGGRIGHAADASNDVFALPPVIAYLTPEQEAATFVLQDGYKLELVLSDPVIVEPVLTVFDGNGRMFVAEMRSYMQDINGTDQRAKNGRVSVHWSSKKDGVYDQHAIYADNLVLPRMILPLDDGVIINETDSDDYWLYHDTKHDGVSDKKELYYSGGARGGNLEHQASGLFWNLDNWLYMAANSYRFRRAGTNVLREDIPSNGGQWGACQDDYGKLWVVNAGYESGPCNFQQPILYGAFSFPEQQADDWPEVWPLIGLADVQGGASRFRPDTKSLNHFTGTCGGAIYRGDRLPADLRGDFLFAEPVGRLIRRGKVENHEGITHLSNPYVKSEFIRSTDPNFRPVNLVSAPDGTIYITDMYRGVIQERDWVNEGSYLRDVVKKYNLDRNVGRGRIWRLVHPGHVPGPQPDLLNETPEKWVTWLQSSNGWWRDTAQKLLVLKQDKSVTPALVKMADSNPYPLARIHALWTLEGLDSLTNDLLRRKLADTDPQVRIAAIRTYEVSYKKGHHSLLPEIYDLAKDPDPNVVIQALLTANLLKADGWQDLITSTLEENKALGVQKIGAEINPNKSAQPDPAALQFTAAEKKVLKRGEVIYKELCFACHGKEGKGTPLQAANPTLTLAPPLSGSQTINGCLDGPISVVLKGLTGPVNGRSYEASMIPMESNDDAWISAVLSYIRHNFENHASFITTNDVARVRAALQNHPAAWTLSELAETLPQCLTNRSEWKLTASHNPGSLHLAVDGNISTRYDTAATQTPGMWVQIELPDETIVSGVEMDAGNSERDYPRGYKIELSRDALDWGEPVATGNAALVRNQIFFPPQKARFVRITQTGADSGCFWSIHELQLWQPATPRELFSAPDLLKGGQESASLDASKSSIPPDSTAGSPAPFSAN